MDSKSLKFVNLKSLSLVIAFLTIGWPQTIKAQYNLQVDSVITDITTGTIGLNNTITKVYEVPQNKIWKITSIISASPAGNAGSLIIDVKDSNGNKIQWTYSNSAETNIKYFQSLSGKGESGILWLNQGCQIIITINPALNGLYDGGLYYALVNALQFSTD